MKLHTHLVLLTILLAALLSGWCETKPPGPDGAPTPAPLAVLKTQAPVRLQVSGGKEVTFYPTYGYKNEKGWNIHLRGWVHESRSLANILGGKIARTGLQCDEAQKNTLRMRAAGFTDDDKSFEKVVVKFDSDDEAFALSKSGANGIVELDLVLTPERAGQLLAKQGSSNGWLTYRAVSKEHTGLGRVRLIEPDPDGVSLISDIDDTIKVTEVPAGQETVLKNTFCLDFKTAPGMVEKYRGLGDIPVHYVSGGPEQLFGPLYDFLITGPEPFPEGTFHLKFFPKNILDSESTRNLVRLVVSSLEVTHDHKIEQITAIMKNFPERKFILSGDSGEIDPEIYNEIKKARPGQVKEIWIRDVLNDDVTNHYRLDGMQVIPVNPPVCIEETHLQKLSAQIKKVYPAETYNPNMKPPCGH